MGQDAIGFFIGCVFAVACSGSTSRNGSGEPQANGGVGAGASAQSSGGKSQNAGGQSAGGDSAAGSGQAGMTAGGGMGGVSGSGFGGLVCPPATPTSPNPAGCPATKPADVQASCEIDAALLCSYWEPTQNVCPQSSLLPSHFRCCDGKWLTEFGTFTPSLTCGSDAGGDSGAGGGR